MLGALVRVYCNRYLDGHSGVGGLRITASFGDLDRGFSLIVINRCLIMKYSTLYDRYGLLSAKPPFSCNICIGRVPVVSSVWRGQRHRVFILTKGRTRYVIGGNALLKTSRVSLGESAHQEYTLTFTTVSTLQISSRCRVQMLLGYPAFG